jgi:hypothetical protein
MRAVFLVLVFSLVSWQPTILGQDTTAQDLQVLEAELSVAFGGIEGKLAMVGDHLIFIDDGRPQNSFSMQRSSIRQVQADNRRVTIATTMPVRDRTGERSELVFQMRNSQDAEAVSRWSRMPAQAANGSRMAPGAPANGIIGSYEARRRTFWGGSRGRLIITQSGVVYEAVDNISDSRRWSYIDIREIELRNPYELRIRPFEGGDYTLELLGQGMDSNHYRLVVDNITASRVQRAE